MSDAVPKEKQTAYQRWELPSFGDERPSAVVEKAAQQTALSMQQLVDVEAAKTAGREAGYAEGFALGQQAGLAEASTRSDEDAERMQQLTQSFDTTLGDVEREAAQDILDLAMDIAKAMLKNALRIQPQLVLPVIKSALQSIPISQQPILTVHPEDAALVRQALHEIIDKGKWEIVEDERIDRGGCTIDTATNQVDATVASRWQQINASLGQETGWLDEPAA
jgi:flagellar assembly protein FliH